MTFLGINIKQKFKNNTQLFNSSYIDLRITFIFNQTFLVRKLKSIVFSLFTMEIEMISSFHEK